MPDKYLIFRQPKMAYAVIILEQLNKYEIRTVSFQPCDYLLFTVVNTIFAAHRP
jgi:hypothetical protein